MPSRLPAEPPSGDYRVSDKEREAAQLRLRADHLEGRLDVDEFEMRMEAANQATLASELGALRADLPQRDYEPVATAGPLPRWPGRRPFNERLVIQTPYSAAYEHALALLVPALETSRFRLQEEKDGVLKFQGPARDDRITVRFRPAPNGGTVLIAHGVAGLHVRRALATLRA